MPAANLIQSARLLRVLLPANFVRSAFAAPEPLPRRPNVLFLFTDDQQADTIHALGNSQIRTPNVDRLIGEGVTFTNAYIMGGSSPGVRPPSRASLLSGRSLWNIDNQGIWNYEILTRSIPVS
jgi:arylsulfatase A-like enzyme